MNEIARNNNDELTKRSLNNCSGSKMPRKIKRKNNKGFKKN